MISDYIYLNLGSLCLCCKIAGASSWKYGKCKIHACDYPTIPDSSLLLLPKRSVTFLKIDPFSKISASHKQFAMILGRHVKHSQIQEQQENYWDHIYEEAWSLNNEAWNISMMKLEAWSWRDKMAASDPSLKHDTEICRWNAMRGSAKCKESNMLIDNLTSLAEKHQEDSRVITVE